MPLIVALHAFGSSGEAVANETGLGLAAGVGGALLLAPDGVFDRGGNRTWNGGACCDFDELGIDDVEYIATLIDGVRASWPVSDVTVVGVEAGGFLAFRVACERPELADAIVSLGGGAPLDAAACAEAVPHRGIVAHGDADQLIAYGGNGEQPGALSSAAFLAGRSGCELIPVVRERIDLDLDIEGRETRIAEFPRCEAGGIELWTAEGAGHRPSLTSAFANRVINLATLKATSARTNRASKIMTHRASHK